MIALVLGIGVSGCLIHTKKGQQIADPARPVADESTVQNAATLKLDVQPYAKANLILAGTVIPVDLALQKKGETIHIRLSASDQMIEEEIYHLLDNEFLLSDASGERFEPAIPLLRFPLAPGRTWEWSGKMFSGEAGREATAKVATEASVLNIAGGPYQTIVVRLKLAIDGGGPTAAERDLAFWFARGGGLVRREFGSSSTREPASE